MILWKQRKAFLILAALLAVYLLGTGAGRGASVRMAANTPAPIVWTFDTGMGQAAVESSARLMAFLGMVNGLQVFGLLLLACPVVLLLGGAAVFMALRAHKGGQVNHDRP